MTRRPSLFQKILIAMFLLGLFLPLVFIEKDPRFSTEKRTPAPFPQWNGSFAGLAAFPKAFEAWFDDHFGFRHPLVQAYHLMNVLVGTTGNSRVLLGQDGWLFYTDPNDGNSLEDYRRTDPLTPEELERWRLVLEAKWAWLKSKGIPYFFIIAPDKHTIYPEYYPCRIHVVGSHSRLDQLMHVLEGTQVPVIDLRAPLRRAKILGPLYHKTDSHWNDLGAAMAHNVIMEQVSAMVPDIRPQVYGADDFLWSRTKGGDLARMLSLAAILQEPAVPVPAHGRAPCGSDLSRDILDSEDPQFVVTFCQSQGKSALVFRDSFFTRLRPYIAPYFGWTAYTTLVPELETLERLVKTYKPDLVLEERVERYLKVVPKMPKPSCEAYRIFQETVLRRGGLFAAP